MDSLFLFISLAVLVGIVGLLSYYFKSRLTEIENKNLKSLEIIEVLYSQQMLMKQIIMGGQHQLPQQQHKQDKKEQSEYVHDPSQYDERIKIVFEESDNEDDDEEDDDSSDDDEASDDDEDESSDEESADDIKKITVDMSFREDCEINIDEDETEYIPEDEPEVNIDEQIDQTMELIVNKLEASDEENKPDLSSSNKDTYKKMSLVALKNVLHSRGIVTDTTRLNKMKKTEIIDLLLVTSLAQ